MTRARRARSELKSSPCRPAWPRFKTMRGRDEKSSKPSTAPCATASPSAAMVMTGISAERGGDRGQLRLEAGREIDDLRAVGPLAQRAGGDERFQLHRDLLPGDLGRVLERLLELVGHPRRAAVAGPLDDHEAQLGASARGEASLESDHALQEVELQIDRDGHVGERAAGEQQQAEREERAGCTRRHRAQGSVRRATPASDSA